MGWVDAAKTALMGSGFIQYPDKALYKAALMLEPAERPTVPVRFYDDPAKLHKEVLKVGAPLSPKAIGVTPYDKSGIYLRRNAAEFKDPILLASKLAHEQAHVRAPAVDRREHPAYQQELNVLNRFGGRVDPNYRATLMRLIDQLRARNQ